MPSVPMLATATRGIVLIGSASASTNSRLRPPAARYR